MLAETVIKNNIPKIDEFMLVSKQIINEFSLCIGLFESKDNSFMTRMLLFWQHRRADFEPVFDRESIEDNYIRAAYDDVACYYSLLMEIRLKLWLLLVYLDSPAKPYKTCSYLPDMLLNILSRVSISRKLNKYQKNYIREVISGWLAEHLGQIYMLSSPSICRKYINEEMDPYTMVEYMLLSPGFLLGMCYFGGSEEYLQSGLAPAIFEADILFRGVLDESFKQHVYTTKLLMDNAV